MAERRWWRGFRGNVVGLGIARQARGISRTFFLYIVLFDYMDILLGVLFSFL